MYLTRRDLLGSAAVTLGSIVYAPVASIAYPSATQVAQAHRYSINILLKDLKGNDTLPDMSALAEKVEHRDETYTLKEVTIDEIKRFYESLAKEGIVADTSSSDLFLDDLAANMSREPNFLTDNFKLIGSRRKGQLVEMDWTKDRAKPLDYKSTLKFSGLSQGGKIHPIDLDYLLLLGPSKSDQRYEISLGQSYETTTLVREAGEGQVKIARILPFDPKDEYLVGNLDLFSRRKKILSGLKAQNIKERL